MSGRAILGAMMVAGLLGLFGGAMAQSQESEAGQFSVFLVRHAEKQAPTERPEGPGLTDCGRDRATHLARLLAGIPLTRVYSSDYQRTLETAAPNARSRGLSPELYDPGDLPSMARQLLQRGEDALVVGHSNTTPVLAGLLLGEDWPELDEAEYDRLYQAVVGPAGARVYQWRQGFDCPG